VVAAVRSDQVTFIAASLAYYAFVSLLPLLLLAVAAASLFGGPELADAVAARVSAALGEQAGALVVDALTSSAGRSGATAVGLAVLLWSGLKLFRGLDVAFATVYRLPGPGSLLEQVRDGLTALGAVGVGVGVTVVVGAAIARFESVLGAVPLVNAVGTLVLVFSLTLALFPLYYVVPDQPVGVREALPGALFAAVGWTALQTGFRVYAANAGSFQAYGVLGGALLLVTWLYFGGLILLIGGVLNAVLAGVIDPDEGVDPLPDANPNAGTAPAPADRETGELSPMREHDSLMSDSPGDGPGDRQPDGDRDRGRERDREELEAELEELRQQLRAFEDDVEDRTVHRDEIEGELKRYVRSRLRRGKARGWGPYLVLLYGTAMTLGAFFYLSGGWAVLAMIVVWLSTLGLYVLFVLVGLGLNAAGVPGRLVDRVRRFRR
jgi:YihY family inner membrane protein